MDAALAPTRISAAEPEAEETGARTGRRDQQVQRILAAAKACFLRSGFQGASMQHICAEAAMSPGALYRYFPSKEAIIAAIVEADRRSDAELLACMGDRTTAVEGVLASALAYVHHVHESGNAPLFIEIRAESMRNPAVRQASLRCMETAAGMIRARLGAAIEAGEIRPVVGLDALVPMMMAAVDGVAMSDLPNQRIPRAAVEAGIRAMVEALLRPQTTGRQPQSR